MVLRKKRVDEDWKRQVDEEKEKIDAAEKKKRAASGEGARGAPGGGSSHLSILSLVEQLAAQAMAGLGQLPDPRTGQAHVDLALARDAIDMIGVLEEKTQGNLSPEEDKTMHEILHSLRMGFAQISRAAPRSASPPPAPPPPGTEEHAPE